MDIELKQIRRNIMELLPIIQLTVVIFATVVLFIILFSYMIYKAKEKKQSQITRKSEVASKKQTSSLKYSHAYYSNNYNTNANKELTYIVPKTHTPVASFSHSKVVERFNIINNQNVNYPIYESSGLNSGFQPNLNVVHGPSYRVASQRNLDKISFS